jgi:type 1 glutamine amidotransferase
MCIRDSDYVGSGRPVLAFHGGIASFDDWPEYGRLLGFAWHWDITTHGPVKEYRVYPVNNESPLTEGVPEFLITDESYFNVQLVPGVRYETHLLMECGDLRLPMLLTTQGDRVAGAGRAAYLALGHDMRAVEHPAVAQLLWNTIRWLRRSDLQCVTPPAAPIIRIS